MVDWNRECIGKIVGSQLSRSTREPTTILVALEPDVRDRLGIEAPALWLPYADVFSIRRGEVFLSRTARDLASDGQPAGGPELPANAVHRSVADALVEASPDDER